MDAEAKQTLREWAALKELDARKADMAECIAEALGEAHGVNPPDVNADAVAALLVWKGWAR